MHKKIFLTILVFALGFLTLPSIVNAADKCPSNVNTASPSNWDPACWTESVTSWTESCWDKIDTSYKCSSPKEDCSDNGYTGWLYFTDGDGNTYVKDPTCSSIGCSSKSFYGNYYRDICPWKSNYESGVWCDNAPLPHSNTYTESNITKTCHYVSSVSNFSTDCSTGVQLAGTINWSSTGGTSCSNQADEARLCGKCNSDSSDDVYAEVSEINSAPSTDLCEFGDPQSLSFPEYGTEWNWTCGYSSNPYLNPQVTSYDLTGDYCTAQNSYIDIGLRIYDDAEDDNLIIPYVEEKTSYSPLKVYKDGKAYSVGLVNDASHPWATNARIYSEGSPRILVEPNVSSPCCTLDASVFPCTLCSASSPEPPSTCSSVTTYTPGSYTFTVPDDVDSVEISLWGGGGGGKGDGFSADVGQSGGDTTLAGLFAGGGHYGGDIVDAVGGVAIGGDINIDGGAGLGRVDCATAGDGGDGGNAPGTGGAGDTDITGPSSGGDGAIPGGGGGGSVYSSFSCATGGGGGGAYVNYTSTVAAGNTYTLVVGAGGAVGPGQSVGGNGADGQAIIEYICN
ncbi:hypothetical protein C0583_02390 [Candidatus Parcubacteria bacterium]|nr:MAG: hypothetical protein C0583_02390 [Candidatus Parcubacteria bacterium]